jgi:hypothetical protein
MNGELFLDAIERHLGPTETVVAASTGFEPTVVERGWRRGKVEIAPYHLVVTSGALRTFGFDRQKVKVAGERRAHDRWIARIVHSWATPLSAIASTSISMTALDPKVVRAYNSTFENSADSFAALTVGTPDGAIRFLSADSVITTVFEALTGSQSTVANNVLPFQRRVVAIQEEIVGPLRDLAKLRDEGIINEFEFDEVKGKIVAMKPGKVDEILHTIRTLAQLHKEESISTGVYQMSVGDQLAKLARS